MNASVKIFFSRTNETASMNIKMIQSRKKSSFAINDRFLFEAQKKNQLQIPITSTIKKKKKKKLIFFSEYIISFDKREKKRQSLVL